LVKKIVVFLQNRVGGYMENFKDLGAIETHIDYVMLRIEEYSALLAFLQERKRNLIAIKNGHEVSAKIQTEKLIERMKDDRNDS
jgi:FMN phosphatase YigB (HAD superfamily)